MSMSSPSVQTYDPFAVAGQQQQYNQQAATESQAMSQTGQNTPFGTLSYAQTGTGPGGVPTYTATTALSPEEQALLTTGQGTQQQAATGASGVIGQGGYGTTPVPNVGSAGPIANYGSNTAGGLIAGMYAPGSSPTVSGALPFANLTQGASGATVGLGLDTLAGGNYGATPPNLMSMSAGPTSQMLGQEVQYLTPYFNQQTEQLDNTLRNQGLDPTTQAYSNAMTNLQGNQNQAVSGFLATAEPQAFSQAVQQYQLPLGTATGIEGLGANLAGLVQPAYSTAVSGYELPLSTASQLYSGLVSPAYSLATAGYQLPLSTGASLYSLGAPASLVSNLVGTPQTSVSPTNLTSAVNSAQQAQIAQAQLAEQQYSGMLGGLAGLGEAGILGGLSGGTNSLFASMVPSLFNSTAGDVAGPNA